MFIKTANFDVFSIPGMYVGETGKRPLRKKLQNAIDYLLYAVDIVCYATGLECVRSHHKKTEDVVAPKFNGFEGPVLNTKFAPSFIFQPESTPF